MSMKDIYIKHRNGYCYFTHEGIKLYLLTLTQFFVDCKIITDKTIKDNLRELKGYCEWNEYYGFHQFKYIHYQVMGTKSIHNPNESFGFDLIKEQYLKIFHVNELIHSLIDALKTVEKQINSLTNSQFSKYLTDGIKRDYLSKKKEYYINKFYKKYEKELFAYALRDRVNGCVEEVMNKIEKDYPNLSVIKCHSHYKKVLDSHLDDVINSWQEVLTLEGEPKEVEGNSATDHFKQSLAYALFCENHYNNTGYLYQFGSSLVPIHQARLFSSEKQAQAYISKNKLDAAIVEVDLKFMKVLKVVGKVDTTNLDAVVAYQEKEHIEKMETAQSLAKKLLSYVEGNEVLTMELEKLLAPKEVKVDTVKTKRKI